MFYKCSNQFCIDIPLYSNNLHLTPAVGDIESNPGAMDQNIYTVGVLH